MSRSLKSALAIAALVVTFGLTTGATAASAAPVHVNGGASGCCRLAQ
ncbi:hypothetical protein ACPPVS_12150 [Cellulomonas sp. McL0617]